MLEEGGTFSNCDPPPEVIARIAEVVELHRGSPGMTDLEVPKSVCGKVVNLVIWEEAAWKLITEHIPAGTFIRLRNVDIGKLRDNNFKCK